MGPLSIFIYVCIIFTYEFSYGVHVLKACNIIFIVTYKHVWLRVTVLKTNSSIEQRVETIEQTENDCHRM